MHADLRSIGQAIARPMKRLGKKIQKVKDSGAVSKIWGALKKEAEIGPVLHKESLGALARMKATDPGLEGLLQQVYGYAIIPRVGRASVVLGGSFGAGEVFKHDRVIGYAVILQATVGVQLGGQTYSELVVFGSREDLDRFKEKKVSFAANASAVIVKAGAAASAGPGGTKVFVQPEGGLSIEADIGAQKFIYIPAALGRVRGWIDSASRHMHHEQ
jgi:hypothetical protein